MTMDFPTLINLAVTAGLVLTIFGFFGQLLIHRYSIFIIVAIPAAWFLLVCLTSYLEAFNVTTTFFLQVVVSITSVELPRILLSVYALAFESSGSRYQAFSAALTRYAISFGPKTINVTTILLAAVLLLVAFGISTIHSRLEALNVTIGMLKNRQQASC